MNCGNRRRHHRSCLVAALLLLAGCAARQPAPDSTTWQPDEATRTAYQAALSQLSAGDLDAAAAQLQSIHQAHPSLAGPVANLGLIAMRQGERDQARGYFQQALAAHPEHLHSLNALGVLARQDADFETAERYYRQALAVNPDFQPALRNLGILLELYRGELAEALALYQRYQALQPEEDPQVSEWIFDLDRRIE